MYFLNVINNNKKKIKRKILYEKNKVLFYIQNELTYVSEKILI